jgi:60S ribosome subunit biogenesis protein NIP7
MWFFSFLFFLHLLSLFPSLILCTYFVFRNKGVVIYSMSDVPLGFGTTAKSTHECRKVDQSAIVVYHQSDVGEYLRNEGTTFN